MTRMLVLPLATPPVAVAAALVSVPAPWRSALVDCLAPPSIVTVWPWEAVKPDMVRALVMSLSEPHHLPPLRSLPLQLRDVA